MIKYRVKQVGLKYYPQYKRFIFWRNAPEKKWILDRDGYEDDFINSNHVLYNKLTYLNYSSLQEAEQHLGEFAKEEILVDKYKGHSIYKAYGVNVLYEYTRGETNIYYYDRSLNKISQNGKTIYLIVGNSVKDVMQQIDVYENKKNLNKVRKIYTYDE